MRKLGVIVLVSLHSQLFSPSNAQAANVTATSTTTSSSWFSTTSVPGTECSYDVSTVDDRGLSSIELAVADASQPEFFYCQRNLDFNPSLDEIPAAQNETARFEMGFLPPFPKAARLLTCYADQGTANVRAVDFTTVGAWAVVARRDVYFRIIQEPVLPPRVCITSLECEGGVPWKGIPRCGDADYDERVSATDALVALRTAVGTSTCAPVQTSCDADGDGEIGAADALAILSAALNIPIALSCPKPCLPGGIGPPGENRLFEIVLSRTGNYGGSDVDFTVEYGEAGEFVGSGAAVAEGGSLECTYLLNVGNGPISIALADDDAGTLSGHMMGPTSARIIEDVASCRFRATGALFPTPDDFVIRGTPEDAGAINEAIVISTIRAL